MDVTRRGIVGKAIRMCTYLLRMALLVFRMPQSEYFAFYLSVTIKSHHARSAKRPIFILRGVNNLKDFAILRDESYGANYSDVLGKGKFRTARIRDFRNSV